MKNILILFLFFSIIVNSQAQVLLKDINSGGGSGSTLYPTYSYNDKLMVFNATPAVFQDEIWKTNGTAAGTVKVVSGIAEYFEFSGNNIFYSNSNSLFVSNGSSGNKQLLYQATDDFFDLINVGQKLLGFVSYGDSIDVIVSNGTAQGTAKVATIREPLERYSTSMFGENIIFTDVSNNSQKFKPFITDGTASGTKYLSDFVSNLGITMDVIGAFGAGDALVLKSSSNTKVYSNGMLGDALTSGEIVKVLTVDPWLVIRGKFGVSVYHKQLQYTYTLPISINTFNGLVAGDSSIYYVSSDNFVHEYNILSEKDRKLAAQSIGDFNFEEFLELNGSWLYYPKVDDSNFSIRRVNIKTLSDELLDNIYFNQGVIPEYAVAFVNNKIVYNKFSPQYGLEWWVKEGTLKTKLISQYLQVKIWPSSIDDELYFDNVAANIITASVRDIAGRCVESVTISDHQNVINLNHLIPGYYFITFKDKNGNIGTYRFNKR